MKRQVVKFIRKRKRIVVNFWYYLEYVTWKFSIFMKLDKANYSNLIIVRLEGYLDMGTFREFEMYVQDLIAFGTTHVGIDLSKCRAIDSSGMGCILRLMNTLKGKNKKLALLEVPTNIKGILKISQIDKYLKIQSVDDFKKEG
jgi:anti-anti-sigma factor